MGLFSKSPTARTPGPAPVPAPAPAAGLSKLGLRKLVKKEEEETNSLAIGELNVVLSRLQNSEGSAQEGSSREVTLVVDRSKRDVGLLIRLYQLQKRMNMIQKCVGDWKGVRAPQV